MSVLLLLSYCWKLFSRVCKRYLEVSYKASNMACRAELGRFPLNIAINQKIINYFLYLHNKGNDSIVKQNFLMSADLHSSGKSSFYSSVMRMSEYYNLPDFDPNVLNKSKIKHYVSLMQHKYILHWQHTIQHSKKLEFYNTFKNEYTPSCYLELTSKLNERKELVKFRIGNHKLMIETKSRELIDFALLADLIKLRMKFTYFFTVLTTQFLETGFTGN